MDNDLDALDRLFAPGPDTLRGDAAGLLVGHDADQRVPRRARWSAAAPHRGDPRAGGRRRPRAGRRGHRARARRPRAADPALGAGRRRVAGHRAPTSPSRRRRSTRGSGGSSGTRCCPPTGTGPLSGESVAVKDLYAVAGQRVGAGNPAWLDEAPVETTNAWAVQRLLDAGAASRGIARTDEFAYSLAGTNAQYGTPPNPKAPRRISGGSSSGSASRGLARARHDRSGYRHRRLDPGARGVPGALGHPHHARAGAHRRAAAARAVLRHRRLADPHAGAAGARRRGAPPADGPGAPATSWSSSPGCSTARPAGRGGWSSDRGRADHGASGSVRPRASCRTGSRPSRRCRRGRPGSSTAPGWRPAGHARRRRARPLRDRRRR